MNIKKAIKISYVFGLLALLFALWFRVSVVKADTTDNTTENLSPFTSEEEKTVQDLLEEGGLSLEQHEQLLNAGRRFLDENENVLTSTPTDADFDTNTYLTYGLDEEWIDSSTTIQSALNDIYRMILSIRNLLVVLIAGLIICWVHKMLKNIIARITKGGVK